MKRIAFISSTVSYGVTIDREGLDASPAIPALTDDPAVFLITDGVSQLLPGQKPDAALVRGYIATFKLLGLHDTEQCWICAASLHERGLDPQTSSVVEVTPLEADALHRELTNYDIILRF